MTVYKSLSLRVRVTFLLLILFVVAPFYPIFVLRTLKGMSDKIV